MKIKDELNKKQDIIEILERKLSSADQANTQEQLNAISETNEALRMRVNSLEKTNHELSSQLEEAECKRRSLEFRAQEAEQSHQLMDTQFNQL